MSEDQVRAIAREMHALLHGPGQVGRQDRLKRLSEALLKALNAKAPVPTVRARLSRSGRRLVVDNCPYCHKTHYHSYGAHGTRLQRTADCLRGEYMLEVGDD